MTVSTPGDGLRHVEYFGENAHNLAHRFTVCGKPVEGWCAPAGPACHVCLPDEVHPLAAVWALCRRWDENANVGAGAPR